MTELELSIMYTNDAALTALRLALQEFETRHKVRVKLRVLSWDTAWSDLVKMAVYKAGPDVSEIGSTWIEGFISMNALRQFTEAEVDSLGGPSVFLPSAWESRVRVKEQVWAIPWLSDTRVIYYRRDLLRQAGIDEQTAFSSFDQFTQTLDRLQQSGVTIPLAIATTHRQSTLHIFAPWVWQAGGHFTSANGKYVLLNTSTARTGIQAYFNLRRYLAPQAQNLHDSQVNRLFRQGQAAVIISGAWTLNAIYQGDATPEIIENLGMAVMPGTPFVGGVDLVVWKNSRQVDPAVALIHYLTSVEVQTKVVVQHGLLPARLEVLNAPPFTTNPHYRIIGHSLKIGRRLETTHRWGLIEDKLSTMLGKLWAILFADPELDVEITVNNYLSSMVTELNRTLAS